jgi:hypothetical protein
MDGRAPQIAIKCFNAATHLGLNAELLATAQKLLSVCLMWQGEWRAATGSFSNILRNGCKIVDPEVLAFRGQCLNHLKRLSESVQDLEAALSVWEQAQACKASGNPENSIVNGVAQRLGVVFAATTHGMASKVYLSLAQPETAASHACYALQYLIRCEQVQDTELASPVYLARALAYAVQYYPGRALEDMNALEALAGAVPVVLENEEVGVKVEVAEEVELQRQQQQEEGSTNEQEGQHASDEIAIGSMSEPCGSGGGSGGIGSGPDVCGGGAIGNKQIDIEEGESDDSGGSSMSFWKEVDNGGGGGRGEGARGSGSRGAHASDVVVRESRCLPGEFGQEAEREGSGNTKGEVAVNEVAVNAQSRIQQLLQRQQEHEQQRTRWGRWAELEQFYKHRAKVSLLGWIQAMEQRGHGTVVRGVGIFDSMQPTSPLSPRTSNDWRGSESSYIATDLQGLLDGSADLNRHLQVFPADAEAGLLLAEVSCECARVRKYLASHDDGQTGGDGGSGGSGGSERLNASGDLVEAIHTAEAAHAAQDAAIADHRTIVVTWPASIVGEIIGADGADADRPGFAISYRHPRASEPISS